MKTLLFLCCITPLLSSCLSERLTAHMDYLSQKSLASYHVKTPDPWLNTPPIGQRILVSWNLPASYLNCYPGLTIKLTVRFCTREEATHCCLLNKRSGMFIYTLINEDYFAKCGVQTYKVELISNDLLIDSWHHQLWTELIQVHCPD